MENLELKNEQLKRVIHQMNKEREEKRKLAYNAMFNMQKMAIDYLEQELDIEVDGADISETIYGYCSVIEIDDITIYLYPYKKEDSIVIMQDGRRWTFETIISASMLINNLL